MGIANCALFLPCPADKWDAVLDFMVVASVVLQPTLSDANNNLSPAHVIKGAREAGLGLGYT